MYSLLMFALFEDDITIFLEPQASQPTAAQPAVMDIRRNLQVLRNVNILYIYQENS